MTKERIEQLLESARQKQTVGDPFRPIELEELCHLALWAMEAEKNLRNIVEAYDRETIFFQDAKETLAKYPGES